MCDLQVAICTDVDSKADLLTRIHEYRSNQSSSSSLSSSSSSSSSTIVVNKIPVDESDHVTGDVDEITVLTPLWVLDCVTNFSVDSFASREQSSSYYAVVDALP